MAKKTKFISIISLTVCLLAVIVLSVSLSNLELQQGINFQNNGTPGVPDRTFPSLLPEDTNLAFILTGILALTCLGLLIYVIIRLSVHINLKSVGVAVLIIAIFIAILYFVPESNQAQPPRTPNELTEETPLLSPTIQGEPGGELPQLLFGVLAVFLVIGLGFIIYQLVRDWEKSAKPESSILQDAEEALNALKDGADLKNVILRCYFQMSATLQEDRGIERETTMTVREFESALNRLGYPPKPVRQLTLLFENIRYGEEDTSLEDEKTAVNSLNEIVQFVQQRGEAK